MMKMGYTAICAVALLALAPGCARMMAASEDGSTPGSTGMSGSAGGSTGAGGQGGGGGSTRTGRAGASGAERVDVKEFQRAMEMADVHFEFDRYEIRSAEESALKTNADWLRTNKNYLVLI